MSEQIHHECGIALLRLLKPLDYYINKYGTPLYGTNKMYLLMQKQHNRGQDGAGLASIKLNMKPGNHYLERERSNTNSAIKDIFTKINYAYFKHYENNKRLVYDENFVKNNIPFAGELLLGHLRYGTYGKNNIESCHPFLIENNWKTKTLALAGNFNMTNVDELFTFLVERLGMFPREKRDTITILEKIAHFINVENEKLFIKYKSEGYSNKEISELIAQNIDLHHILKKSAENWDGGYVIGGLLGHGDAFIMRDPNGIRPAYYYYDDEIFVATSERPAIQTAFKVPYEKVKEVENGQAIVIKQNGEILIDNFCTPLEKKACSFERIYFSRGTDAEIYKERKALGHRITNQILKSIDYDLKNTVFSYIPNTAQDAFFGLGEALFKYTTQIKQRQILALNNDITKDKLNKILNIYPRIEKIAVKDVKLRTFITQDNDRDDLVSHVYDITYGSIKKGKDTLVAFDDSIVRGTTLKQSILKMLDRLGPKKIIIVSSAPQIRYPDCYGIDMAKLGDFIAFQATISLLKENNMEDIINKVYNNCKKQENLPKEQIKNYVKDIYKPFTAQQISAKIATLITPKNFNAELEVIFQTIEDLHSAIPNNTGDWYFTGNYPTPGGYKVVNKSFINFIEGKNERAY